MKKIKQSKRVLHLTLFRKWFDAIAGGDKRVEYRRATPYWEKRLRDREYDEVHFRNGYAKDAPFMRVRFEGIRCFDGQFQIFLGKVVEIKNWSAPK